MSISNVLQSGRDAKRISQIRKSGKIARENLFMKMTELKQKAKSLGIKPGKKKKADLIHAIQQAEGNPTCFSTAEDYCDQEQCSYREDCFKAENDNKP